MRIPYLRCGEFGFALDDLRAGNAAIGSAAEQVIEVEGLDRVVSPDAMAGGLGAEACAFKRLIGLVTAGMEGRRNQGVVFGLGDDEGRIGGGKKMKSDEG